MTSSDFPVSIDLAIHPKEGGALATAPTEAPSKGKKPKPYYPSLYISNVEGLDSLPREGYALIHFKRRSVTVTHGDESSCCSADLEIHEISLPEKSSEEESGDLGDALKSVARKSGIDTGEEDEEAEEEAEETPEEEAAEHEED